MSCPCWHNSGKKIMDNLKQHLSRDSILLGWRKGGNHILSDMFLFFFRDSALQFHCLNKSPCSPIHSSYVWISFIVTWNVKWNSGVEPHHSGHDHHPLPIVHDQELSKTQGKIGFPLSYSVLPTTLWCWLLDNLLSNLDLFSSPSLDTLKYTEIYIGCKVVGVSCEPSLRLSVSKSSFCGSSRHRKEKLWSIRKTL